MGRSPLHQHPQDGGVWVHLQKLRKQLVLWDASVYWGLRVGCSGLSVRRAGIPNRGNESRLSTSRAACLATLALRPLVQPLKPNFEGSGSADELMLLSSFSEGISGLILSWFHSARNTC